MVVSRRLSLQWAGLSRVNRPGGDRRVKAEEADTRTRMTPLPRRSPQGIH
jgi:hypothetical protein